MEVLGVRAGVIVSSHVDVVLTTRIVRRRSVEVTVVVVKRNAVGKATGFRVGRTRRVTTLHAEVIVSVSAEVRVRVRGDVRNIFAKNRQILRGRATGVRDVQRQVELTIHSRRSADDAGVRVEVEAVRQSSGVRQRGVRQAVICHIERTLRTTSEGRRTRRSDRRTARGHRHGRAVRVVGGRLVRCTGHDNARGIHCSVCGDGRDGRARTREVEGVRHGHVGVTTKVCAGAQREKAGATIVESDVVVRAAGGRERSVRAQGVVTDVEVAVVQRCLEQGQTTSGDVEVAVVRHGHVDRRVVHGSIHVEVRRSTVEEIGAGAVHVTEVRASTHGEGSFVVEDRELRQVNNRVGRQRQGAVVDEVNTTTQRRPRAAQRARAAHVQRDGARSHKDRHATRGERVNGERGVETHRHRAVVGQVRNRGVRIRGHVQRRTRVDGEVRRHAAVDRPLNARNRGCRRERHVGRRRSSREAQGVSRRRSAARRSATVGERPVTTRRPRRTRRARPVEGAAGGTTGS